MTQLDFPGLSPVDSTLASNPPKIDPDENNNKSAVVKLPPGRESSSRPTLEGGHVPLRLALLRLSEILRHDPQELLLGVCLSEVNVAVFGFLRDRNLGAAGAARSHASVAPGPLTPLAGSSRTEKLSAAEKASRRRQRKFAELKSRGMI